jgi:hypothetical protein
MRLEYLNLIDDYDARTAIAGELGILGAAKGLPESEGPRQVGHRQVDGSFSGAMVWFFLSFLVGFVSCFLACRLFFVTGPYYDEQAQRKGT